MRLTRLSATLALALAALCPAAWAAADAYGPEPLSPEEASFVELATSLPADAAMPGLVARAGARFIGRPYGEHLLDGAGDEPLVCRLDAFDCVTFVESSLAIARAVASRHPNLEAFHAELERVRYRHGHREGYGSRLHYFSDWIADNERRGIVKNLTAALGGKRDPRPITFMSTHRKAYPLLADDGLYAQVEAAEAEVSRTPRYVLPKDRVASILPLLQSGDIVAIATDIEGLDIVHTGLIYRKPNGAVHLLHAPEPGEVVTVSSMPLVEYLQQYKVHTGVMIARPLKP
jgi:hypothetical protein